MNAREEGGSILLTALLISLGTALLVVGLAGAVGLARSGREAEEEGRRLLWKAEQGLTHAVALAESAWEPGRVEPANGLTVTLAPVSGTSGRLLRATATVRGSSSTCEVSAVVERGADGLDLPWRAAVAGSLDWDMSRTEPLVSREAQPAAPERSPEVPAVTEEGGVPGALAPVRVTVARVGSAPLFEENVILEVGRSWTLDAGTAAPAREGTGGVWVLAAPPGFSVRQVVSPDGRRLLGSSGETPVVLIATGGGPLDAAGLGELYGVILAGLGGVDLEGTVLHGAVFTEGALRFGATGQVVFNEGILDWARYRSMTRVRLVPGTRQEGFSGPNT